MKRKMAMALLTVAFCAVSSMTVFAMPEQMPDGGVFDAEYYAEENPDVVAVMGNEKDALYLHYTLAGKNEGRLPGVAFDAEYYAANNPDVAAVLGTEEDVLYRHYRLCGKSEGRQPSAPGTELKPLKSSEQNTPSETTEQPLAGGIQGTFGETYTISTFGENLKTGAYQETKMKICVDSYSVNKDGFLDIDNKWPVIAGYQAYRISGEVRPADEYGGISPWRYMDWGIDRVENVTWFEDSWQFTVTQDGVAYPECRFVAGGDAYAIYPSVMLPQNYDGELRFVLYAAKMGENGELVQDEQNFVYYVIK